MVLGYFELPDDERPDVEIWHHGERLRDWFKAVEQRRKNPDQKPIDDESFDVPVMQNQDPMLDELRGR